MVDTVQASQLNNYYEDLEQYNLNWKNYLATESREWNAGDTIWQEDLGRVLERIRDNGKAGFYDGETARILAAFMESNGGLITENDLQNYKAVWREPVKAEFKGYRFLTMAPPSSGGVALAQLLGMYEILGKDSLQWNSWQYIQLIAEIERRVYADRSEFLGDPDFIHIPVNELLTSQYLESRCDDIISGNQDQTSESVSPGMVQAESEQTTHYSIVDKEGNAVSVTHDHQFHLRE